MAAMNAPLFPASVDAKRLEAKPISGSTNAFVFIVLTLVLMWLAHGFAFFTHEYSHSIMAWLLGWKSNPLNLHFPTLSRTVLLIQLGINQNVNNIPIFASGHGRQAALIAAAGPVIGNGFITYLVGMALLRYGIKVDRHTWALLGFWIVAASVGNLIDYVPIRTFTGSSDDMGILATGLGWSPWLVLIVLGIPTLIITAHFVWRLAPLAVRTLYPVTQVYAYATAILSILAIFDFYGSAGFLEGDQISYRMSLLSVFLVTPIILMIAIARVRRIFSEPA